VTRWSVDRLLAWASPNTSNSSFARRRKEHERENDDGLSKKTVLLVQAISYACLPSWHTLLECTAVSCRTGCLLPRVGSYVCAVSICELTSMRYEYDTIRDAILTCARKPARVSLIYRTEPTTKKCKTRKKTKSRRQICSEITVNSPGNPCSEYLSRRQEGLQWESCEDSLYGFAILFTVTSKHIRLFTF